MNTTMETGRQPENLTGLGQIERVVDAYVAPTKTFFDIRRDASWWLPFILGIIVSFFFVSAISRQIGFDHIAELSMAQSTAAQQQITSLTPEQRAHQIHIAAEVTKVISYAYPAVTLIIALICAGILMASFNFGLGAKAPFKQYFAVWFYAGLPMLIKYILAAASIFAGASVDQFDMRNPVGTNIGWYLSSDSPHWLKTLLASADVFTIWTVVLLIIGCATVAKVKRSSAAFLVIGWWILIILASTVGAAFQG